MTQPAPAYNPTSYTRRVGDRAAYEAFIRDYPAYATTLLLDSLRDSEYARLDAQQHVYLDYTGASLYAESQLRDHLEILSHGVFGNPHSASITSSAATDLVERTRRAVLDWFSASPQEYTAVFTSNCTGALKHVGESFPFAPGGRLLLTFDNHNSVNGIREFARARGAAIEYAPLTMPELRLDRERLETLLRQAAPGADNLFVFPAQSNFTGVQHPLELVATRARSGGRSCSTLRRSCPPRDWISPRYRPTSSRCRFTRCSAIRRRSGA